MDITYVMTIASYILSGHNITETALYFNKSRKAIYNYLDVIMNQDSNFYNKSLAEKITLTLEKLKLEARKSAGAKSKRRQVLSDADVYQIINQILTNRMPLRTIAKQYNCSHTTVAKAIKRVADEETLKEIKIIYDHPEVEDKPWTR